MSTTGANEQDQQRIDDAWAMYRDLPRVTQTAKLYGAGFAYGGLVAYVPDRDYNIVLTPIAADEGLLREIGIKLFVGGSASASLEVKEEELRLVPGDEFVFSYVGLSGMVPGLLTAFSQNYPSFRMFREKGLTLPYDILDDSIGTILPNRIMQSPTAEQVSGPDAWQILNTYVYAVHGIRNSFVKQMAQFAKKRVKAIDVQWAAPWMPDGKLGGEYLLLGPAYQAFQAEGIELSGLKRDAIGYVRRFVDSSLVSREEANVVLTSFGDRA